MNRKNSEIKNLSHRVYLTYLWSTVISNFIVSLVSDFVTLIYVPFCFFLLVFSHYLGIRSFMIYDFGKSWIISFIWNTSIMWLNHLIEYIALSIFLFRRVGWVDFILVMNDLSSLTNFVNINKFLGK